LPSTFARVWDGYVVVIALHAHSSHIVTQFSRTVEKPAKHLSAQVQYRAFAM
jgi:hypothetical protein